MTVLAQQTKATPKTAPKPVPQPELRAKAAQREDAHVPRVQTHVRAQGQPDPAPRGPRP